jgi:hypothetical protein
MEDVLACRSVQIIMERSHDDAIKSRTVQREDTIWQELRDELFLTALTYGRRIKSLYDELTKPAEISFTVRDWDIFKGVYTVALALGDPQTAAAMVAFGVDVHASKVERDNENSPDTIILQFLAEYVTRDDYYELGELNAALTEMASTQGLDLQGMMTRERLASRIRTLKVSSDRKRGMRSGKKVTLYRMEPETIRRKLRIIFGDNGVDRLDKLWTGSEAGGVHFGQV